MSDYVRDNVTITRKTGDFYPLSQTQGLTSPYAWQMADVNAVYDDLDSLRTQLSLVGSSFTSIATAGATTTLTNATSRKLRFTGSSAQTVVMPAATTMLAGEKILISNASTGALTLQDGAAGALGTVVAGGFAEVTALTIATTAGTWEVILIGDTNVASALVKRDANGDFAGRIISGARKTTRTTTSAATYSANAYDGIIAYTGTTGCAITLPAAAGVGEITVVDEGGNAEFAPIFIKPPSGNFNGAALGAQVDDFTVSLWRFNESSGATVADAVGSNATTPNGNQSLTCSDTSASCVTGMFGKGRSTASSVNLYGTNPIGTLLNNMMSTASWTLEGWVKPLTGSGGQVVIFLNGLSFGTSAGSPLVQIGYDFTNTKFSYLHYDGNGTAYTLNFGANASAPNNAWYHIAITHQIPTGQAGNQGTVAIGCYQNGVQVAYQAMGPLVNVNPTADHYWGFGSYRNTNTATWVHGGDYIFDDWRLSSKIRSGQEIAEVYAAGQGWTALARNYRSRRVYSDGTNYRILEAA